MTLLNTAQLQCSIQYKRSGSQDGVPNQFKVEFDPLVSTTIPTFKQFRQFDVTLLETQVLTFNAPASATNWYFVMIILRDPNPAEMFVQWTSNGVTQGLPVRGANPTSFPQSQDTSGGFMILPKLDIGSSVVLSGSTQIKNCTIYMANY